ncbi:MAG: hypothetical protein ACI845_001954 [Gammaproteobacteria bacterium]|jgi:hypothetical protein
MTLPLNINREQKHRRQIECIGYLREDNLWDIEAHLVDTRSYDCSYDPNHRGGLIKAGEPVHDMWLRITIDLDFNILQAVAFSDKTPFAVCSQARSAMKDLVGIRIGAGWMKQVRERIATRVSCTHLMDLLGPISATAYQTLHAAIEERDQKKQSREKPAILDTCIALATDGDVVKNRWPDFYKSNSTEQNSS